MAIKQHDHLATLLSDFSVDRRRDIWIWLYLESRGAQLLREDINTSAMRDKMANYLSHDQVLLTEICNARDNYLVPAEYLKWISEEKRQHLWILQRIELRRQLVGCTYPTRLLGRERVVAMIDAWPADLNTKIYFLNGLSSEWTAQKKKDKQLDWFKGLEEHERCSYAWDWLIKKYPGNLFLSDAVEDHNSLLIFFDRLLLTDIEQAAHIKTIKGLLTQKSYRQKSVGKKQQNFILSDKAIERLKKLSDTHELKRTQILEILLKMESEKDLYISEYVRIRKDIET